MEEQLRFIETQIPNVRAELQEAESDLATYSAEEGAFAISEQAEGLIDQFAEVQGRLSELSLRRQDLTRRFTPSHPRVEALDEQIEELRGDLEELDSRLSNLPRSEREYVRRQRDVAVNNELYTQLLSKMQELRVMQAGEIGNVRIVDRPVTPIEPVKPKKGLVTLISLVLGGFLGLGAVFARESLRRTIEDPDMLEAQVGMPVYAVIPHSSRQDKLQRALQREEGRRRNVLLSTAESADTAVEALRSLRTSLQFALINAPNTIVGITGPAQGIGKSFVTSNLAAVTAPTGKRVLLVDADMRRGELHRYFTLPRDPGLSQAIAGEIDWPAAIQSTELDNVDLLASGSLPPNPSELLMAPAFSAGLKEIAKNYDLILMDTPPVLVVTDGLIVARQCGTLFLVLKAGQHSKREIEHSISRLAKNGARPHGLIFNDLTQSVARRSGYYYYHYGYS